MLYASLICSGIILIAAILALRYSETPVRVTLGWGVCVALAPALITFVFPAVWFQLAILCGGLLIAEFFGRTRRSLAPLSVVSLLIAYGYVGITATEKQQARDRLRAEYPFESMEERLSRPVPPSAGGDPERLDRLEYAVAGNVSRGREAALARLHHGKVRQFVSSAGFGVGRMAIVSEPTERNLKPEPRDDAPDQPDYFRLAPRDGDRLPARPNPLALGRLHEAGFLDFVNPGGFGFVNDRRHVAGFRSHGFSKVPDPAGEWKVATLELVGLLRHDDPVVYVSSKLPRMDELKDAPTRPLDAFEVSALAALRTGADLHTDDRPDGLRLLGAIRSTKQCVECHGGERGALLGAFTYRLTPAGNEAPRK